MKWWFWVVLGIVFIYMIAAIMPYPGCEETENDLRKCEESVSSFIDAWDEYNEALEEYCELDPTNPLC